VGLLGRVRASRARAQNTAPAFARFARETEPGAALRLEGAERKSLSSAGRQSHEDHVATTLQLFNMCSLKFVGEVIIKFET
jgi:hypothetical protein